MAIARGPLRDRGSHLDLVGFLGLAGIGLLMWRIELSEPGTNFGIRYDPWLFRGGFLWVSVATLMVIAAVTHQATFLGRFLGNPVLNYLGTRSYGLYLYHWPIYQIIRTYAGIPLTFGQFALAMAITLPITEVSYRFVETPIRKGRLGEWWRGRHDIRRRSGPPSPLDNRRPIYAVSAVVLALVGFSVFSVATATNKCVGDVECTLQGAASASTVPATSTTVAGAVTPSTDAQGNVIEPATTVPASTTSTTLPPPPPMAAFGESVMLGAINQLQAGGFTVDARENRQADEMVADIEAAKANGRLGQVVVVQVGTNGTVTDREIESIIAAMPPDTRLYFMTVKADRAVDRDQQRQDPQHPGHAPERRGDRLGGPLRRDRRPAEPVRRRCAPAHEEGHAVLRQHGLRGDRPPGPGAAAPRVTLRLTFNLRRRWPYWSAVQAWPPPRAQQAQISRLPYTPGLDGLRALAVLAVMVYHANHTWLPGGFLGVEIFFVISGYLITLLLIGEHERKGRISLKRFWLRRARRLLPALVVLLVGAAIYLAFVNRAPQGQARGDFVGAVTYGSNWYQIAVGQGYTASAAFAPLRHLWSLAVEEQFYLLWPLVMAVLLRGKLGAQRLPKIGLWLFVASATIAVAVGALFVPGDVATSCSPEAMHGFWRIGSRCINVNELLYLGTFTRAGGVLLGAALAMWWRPVAILRGPLRDKPRRLDLLALVGLAGIGWLTWTAVPVRRRLRPRRAVRLAAVPRRLLPHRCVHAVRSSPRSPTGAAGPARCSATRCCAGSACAATGCTCSTGWCSR